MSHLFECTNFIPGSEAFQPGLLNLPLPLPALLIFATLGYVGILLLIFLSYRKFRRPSLHEHGVVKTHRCQCYITLTDIFNCFTYASIDACLTGLCPQRKSYDCVDLLFCEVCTGGHRRRRTSQPVVSCPTCCQSIYCEDATFCCFTCSFRDNQNLVAE